MKPWYLYLIECSDRSIYTGIAVDVAARVAAHRSGKGARYTRAHPPLRLLACFRYPDRVAAARAEYRVKQMSADDKRHLARCCQATRDDLTRIPARAAELLSGELLAGSPRLV